MTARHSRRFITRPFLTVSVLSLSLVGVIPTVPAVAQDDAGAVEAVPAVPNGNYNFVGEVTANAVNVRSGPGDNYYPTKKLDKGARVTVVGIKYDWLKILPPAGSFCYVAKAYVSQKEDGSVGVVEKTNLNVRAGSELNDVKWTVQTKLDPGAEVKIIGEKDEYFKIEPPTGAFLYVKKDFVNPVEQLADTRTVTEAAASAANDDGPVVSEPVKPAAVTEVKPSAERTAAATGPKTTDDAVTTTALPGDATAAAPSTQPANDKTAAAPSTQPAVEAPSASARFDKVDADFLAFSKDKIEDQPVDAALTEYEALIADATLPESMRHIARARVETLKLRKDAQTNMLSVRDMQRQMDERKQTLAVEQQELAERIKAQSVSFYTAVGTLRSSSLQVGPKTLYRLTDPATGRTVVYVMTDDVKYAGMIGQFIGVKGNVTDDAAKRMKYIVPTETAAVDQTQVATGNVTAEIIPASILQSTGTASTGNQ